MSHDVFLSYSSIDRPIADAICAALEAKGVRCWMAPRNILPGLDWSASIVDAIRDSSLMVLVFSSNANTSFQIRREVERAVNKGVPILPFRVENVNPDKSLEYYIGSLQWLDAHSGSRESHLDMLADTVIHLLGRGAVPRRYPASTKVHPSTLALGLIFLLIIAVGGSYALIKTLPYFMSKLRSEGVLEKPKSAENPYYADGVRQFESGDYDSAIASLDKAIKEDPQKVDAYHYRGQAYFQKQNYDKAIADYNQVVKMSPTNAEAYHHRGLANSSSGNQDQALLDYSEAIRLKPDFAEAYSKRAEIYQAQGKSELAIQDYNRSLAVNSNQAETYYERGMEHSKLDQHNPAISDFTQAIKLNPKHSKAFNHRGLSYQATRKTSLALSDYTQAIKLDPSYAEPYCNRGAIYMNQGNVIDAKKDFDRCGKLDPGWNKWIQGKLKKEAEKQGKNVFKKLKDKLKKIF